MPQPRLWLCSLSALFFKLSFNIRAEPLKCLARRSLLGPLICGMAANLNIRYRFVNDEGTATVERIVPL